MRNKNGFDGTLIAVEGIDGAGKSTVVDAIEQWADDAGKDVVTTREPTDLWTGEQVYRALGDEDTPPLADFSLFVADRVKHVEERIKPALERGAVVVTDRYADSTRAYQTHRIAEQTGMDYDEARDWMEHVFEPFNVEPDITIYIDIPVDTAMERCDVGDKYEKRENLEQVREAYNDLYGLCDPSCRIIDGTQPISTVRHKAIGTVKMAVHKREVDEQMDRLRTYAEAAEEEA